MDQVSDFFCSPFVGDQVADQVSDKFDLMEFRLYRTLLLELSCSLIHCISLTKDTNLEWRGNASR